LPFFKEEEETVNKGFLKLKKTKSDKPHQKTVSDLFSSENSQEAILVQLPGTLPFTGLEPHNGKGL
jgi:hypothetical protein